MPCVRLLESLMFLSAELQHARVFSIDFRSTLSIIRSNQANHSENDHENSSN